MPKDEASNTSEPDDDEPPPKTPRLRLVR